MTPPLEVPFPSISKAFCLNMREQIATLDMEKQVVTSMGEEADRTLLQQLSDEAAVLVQDVRVTRIEMNKKAKRAKDLRKEAIKLESKIKMRTAPVASTSESKEEEEAPQPKRAKRLLAKEQVVYTEIVSGDGEDNDNEYVDVGNKKRKRARKTAAAPIIPHVYDFDPTATVFAKGTASEFNVSSQPGGNPKAPAHQVGEEAPEGHLNADVYKLNNRVTNNKIKFTHGYAPTKQTNGLNFPLSRGNNPPGISDDKWAKLYNASDSLWRTVTGLGFGDRVENQANGKTRKLAFAKAVEQRLFGDDGDTIVDKDI
ncbi:hypothetical protein BJ878DRAFT_283101 [Calycina marina]|uniref:Uncharacterized protein n=1 Tax=Calycina marina TaxID=1763456 RepID=A0A9P7Z789_9HELO|nr:hypothetical protein BJ878DRAFT_283101 [Calycina marina]